MKAPKKQWRWLLLAGAASVAMLLIVAVALAVEFQAAISTTDTFGDPPALKGIYKVGETVNYFIEIKNTSTTVEAYELAVCFEDPDGVIHAVESDFVLAPRWSKKYYPDRIEVYNGADVLQSSTPTDLSFLAYEVTATTPIVEEAGVKRFYADLCVTGKQEGPAGTETIDYRLDLPRRLISPSTVVSISADPASIYSGGEVAWTITEENNGDVALTDPYVNLNTAEADSAGLAKLMAPPDSGDTNADGILDPGETWEWEVKTSPTANVTVWAYGHGMDPVGDDIDYLFDADEKDSASVKVIDPSTKVSISADPETVYKGDEVVWTITEENNGDAALTDPYVNLNTAEVDAAGLAKLMAPPDSGDTNADGILDPGETWEWEVKTNPTADVTVWAYGHGMDPLGADIDYVFDADEKDSASVKVINPAIDIIKYVSVDGGATWHDANTEGEAPEAPEAGAPIKWKIVVSNPNDFEMKITGLEDIFADQAMLAGYVDTVLAPMGEPGDSFEVIYDDVAPDAGMSKMNLAKVCAVDTMIGTKEVCDEDPAWVKSPEMGGPTRTVGFWGQHFEYTKHVFEMECGGSIDLGWVTLDHIDEVMAVLNYDAVVKVKGLTPEENKVLNTSRQLVAAILNQCAFGTEVPMIDGKSIIEIAQEEFAKPKAEWDYEKIVWIGWELDQYNNSGDEYELYGWDEHFDDDVNYWAPASPKEARASAANAVAWLLGVLRS